MCSWKGEGRREGELYDPFIFFNLKINDKQRKYVSRYILVLKTYVQPSGVYDLRMNATAFLISVP